MPFSVRFIASKPANLSASLPDWKPKRFISSKSASRLIIDAVNRRYPKEALGELTDGESAWFDAILKDALKHQERYGEWPVFEMGEIEYDDPVLDIYGDA